ncbi:MAG: Hpt domain-containing protein, partial [Gemmatimonadaceae bacterium]
VRAMAHALKSSAGQMGAPRLQSLCEQIENPEQPLDLARALSELEQEFSRYCHWLTTAFPAPQSP